MEAITFLIDFVLHVDRYIGEFVQSHGTWVYALLFAIVFVETGVVLMPFLPGDSLLFITGAMCGVGLMSLPVAMVVLLVAAILGDQCNFLIGRRVGNRVFAWDNARWFNRRAFDQAHAFYQRHGPITLVIARFMPFVRTFAPFVAGVAAMDRARFTLFNVVGALIWVLGLCSAGYWFGNLEIVRKNLQIIIWALIVVPGLLAILASYRASRSAQ